MISINVRLVAIVTADSTVNFNDIDSLAITSTTAFVCIVPCIITVQTDLIMRYTS